MRDRRFFLKAGGAVLAGSLAGPIDFASAMPAQAEDIDPLTLVDPDLRAMAAQFKLDSGKYPPLSLQTLARTRAMVALHDPAPLETVPFEQRTIPGVGGNPDVGTYVINAKSGTARPAIVYMHGGGFILGSAKSVIREMQDLSAALDCCVVAVDYRLAPETTFRGSVEDCYAALLWTHAHATEIGGDPGRIAVMGESAGGGLAALLAIKARDRGEVPVTFQMLVYPMLDDRTGSTRRMPKYMGAFVWDEAANRFGWQSFLGEKPGSAHVPLAGVPARVRDLTRLPPTFIGVGSIDLFATEDIEYADRLLEAGVPTELHVIPGAFHGFDHDKLAPVSKRFNDLKREALRRALGIAVPDSAGGNVSRDLRAPVQP